MLKTEVVIAFLFLTRLYEFFEGGNEPVFGGALVHPTNRQTRDHRRQETACLADVANPGCWGIQRFAALSLVRETT